MLLLISHFEKTIFIYQSNVPELKVSVIIPFRNEEENICKCIDSVLNQNFSNSKFEIIAVNDHSDDQSITRLEKYKNNNRVNIITNKNQGKKHALLTGIYNAKNEIILTLDADCTVNDNWLISMCNIYEKEQCQMLCGPISYQTSDSLFQKLQQAESAAILGISFTLNNLKLPSTCNGANLMFDKNSFIKVGGYRHIEIDSGDDDLLMHDFFKSNLKIVATLNKDCTVQTTPCQNFQEFKAQRLRWISKAKHYQYSVNNKIQLMVIIQNLSFYIALIYSLFEPQYILLISLKFFSDFMYGIVLSKQLKLKIYTILLIPFYQLYMLYILLNKKRGTKWKKRTINV